MASAAGGAEDPRTLPSLLRLTPAPKETMTGPAAVYYAAEADWWRINNSYKRAFGGQLAGHCVVAAASVAPAGFEWHSLHLYFLRAGQMTRTRYEVHELRVGRSFALYEVTGFEENEAKPIVRAAVSFHNSASEKGPPLYVSPPPKMPPPETSPTRVPNIGLNAPSPTDDHPNVRQADSEGRAWWIRLSQRSDEALTGPALWGAIAFMSDLQFLWVAVRPFRGVAELTMITSLDHTVHFHGGVAAVNGWLLYACDSPFAASGRAVVRGKIWTADGAHMATTMQEGVLRVKLRGGKL